MNSVTGKRRPPSLSRRQKSRLENRRLGFESLEARQMLSAESPLAQLQGAVSDDIQLSVQSLSSSTAEGELAILQQELYWQSLLENIENQYGPSATRSIPTDPLVGNQWHLINTGQEVGSPDFQVIFGIPGEDINVAPAWNAGFTGAGVVVAVIDSGVETDHPDLAGNISSTLQLNALTGATDGNPFFLDDSHGTSVAGLIGAIADNGIGGTGVAPGVTLAPINLTGGLLTEQSVIDAFRFATDEIDITNNSWGPSDLERSIDGPTQDELLALRDSVIFGRDGKGVIHLWAAGNGASTNFDEGFLPNGVFDTASYDGYVASRYTIGVTGVDHDGFFNNFDGTFTDYPETSSAVFIAAPTGSVFYDIVDDTGLGSGIWTTDTTGEFGSNISPDPDTGQEFDRDFLADTDYTSRFNGTSASTPIATGVVALMLEANPSLSWRDVQEILIRSARQNAEFDIPSTLGLGATQNTWIINQMPVFHDPDVFDPTIDPDLQTLSPTLDPTFSAIGFFGATAFSGGNNNHFQPTPAVLTNGAGYTISQGVGPGGQNIGFAHGVVDAEMAVQLAQQWHTKNQALPSELTFTTSVLPTEGPDFNIPAAERGNDDSGNQLVPGGILGSIPGGFINYWNEYYEDAPDFSQDFETRGGFIEFALPDSNTMTVESIDVKLSISGANAQFMDRARVLLVSPNGTHSELNQFWIEVDITEPITLQNISLATIGGEPGSVDPDDGNFVWTFTTNRNWGERSDNAIIFDSTTMEPAGGIPLSQGWQLHIENYDRSDSFGLGGLEIAWHGSPIGADTQRIQGLIGVDDNQDDQFNYSRVQQQIFNFDGDPTTLRYGEVFNVIDPDHESMGANITVTATRASDGVVVDQFVTGADGNYYFDLTPDDYIISIVDPLGRTAVDDSLTPAGFLKDYQTEWTITSDFFKVWDYDAALEVPVDASGVPFDFLDAFGAAIPDHVKNINFLLDPGAPALPQVDFSGMVYADTNGDGIFNGDDVAVPEISLFGDVNQNGQFDAGEILVKTDAAGEYSLTVPNTISMVMNIGVVTPVDWTPTNPSSGLANFFVQPGDTFTGVDFAIMPPGLSTGDGSSLSGILLGVVYEDTNSDAARQSGEAGISGLRVYLDNNATGAFDAGDTEATTNIHGAFAFADVPAGSHLVRVEVASPLTQTSPLANLPFTVVLAGAGTFTGIQFGINNSATLDFGDLPGLYGVTTLAEDGARHPKGLFFLGQRIDAELDGQPSSDALDDDAIGDDEDGIVFDAIEPGVTTTGRFVATASRQGGYLTGWMDFNGDGDFDDVIDGVGERLVMRKSGGPAVTRLLLNSLDPAGANEVFFDVPTTIDAATIFARFRFSEFDIDSLTGLAQIGEVEDYAIAPVIAAPLVSSNGADFDNDGDVDGSDFLAWQRGFGQASGAAPTQGDANGDGAVDGNDLAEWQTDFGNGGQVALVVESADFDTDGDVDGSDFLAWQRGSNIVSGALLSNGDANQDGAVNAPDLGTWEATFGTTSSSGAAMALMSGGSESSESPVGSSSLVAATYDAAPYDSATVAQQSVSSEEASAVTTLSLATRSVGPTIDPSSEAVFASVETNAVGLITNRFQPTRLDLRSTSSGGRLNARLDHFRPVHQQTRSMETDDLGPALHDRVLADLYETDRFADRRHEDDLPRNYLAERLRNSTDEIDQREATLAAFGEEIDWRL